jgi:hypothetical protein
MVVFPNYGVISIYASEDGGATWIPVSGNLEEFPDGSGSGPSVRWVSILYVQDSPVYFAGTSVGLFSATELDSMNTRWIPEGGENIGNIVIDMIDVRQSDGYVAVATHGNGVYSSYITEIPSSLEEIIHLPASLLLYPAYPNPFNATTTIKYSIPYRGWVKLQVYNMLGEKVMTLIDNNILAGEHELQWTAADLASGTYIIKMRFENHTKTQKVMLVK